MIKLKKYNQNKFVEDLNNDFSYIKNDFEGFFIQNVIENTGDFYLEGIGLTSQSIDTGVYIRDCKIGKGSGEYIVQHKRMPIKIILNFKKMKIQEITEYINGKIAVDIIDKYYTYYSFKFVKK